MHADFESYDPEAAATAGPEGGRRGAVMLIDAEGRLHVDPQMMKQVASAHEHSQPHEVLFVPDAMTGQDALASA